MRSTRTGRLSLLLALGLALATMTAAATAAHAQDAGAGKAVFERNCGFCHGMFGQGKLAVPNLAGGAGHLERMGVPMEALASELTNLVRHGIPSRMPSFPPEALSDQDIPNLGAYLMTLPPASGTSIYLSNCAMCHGPGGEGVIGPPLVDTPQFVAGQGWTLDQTAEELGRLVHGGIPTRMPGFPHLTDLEIKRLTTHLLLFDQVTGWATEFRAREGHAPALRDYTDRGWSLEFAAQNGRQPTAAEWAAHMAESRSSGPPPGP